MRTLSLHILAGDRGPCTADFTVPKQMPFLFYTFVLYITPQRLKWYGGSDGAAGMADLYRRPMPSCLAMVVRQWAVLRYRGRPAGLLPVCCTCSRVLATHKGFVTARVAAPASNIKLQYNGNNTNQCYVDETSATGRTSNCCGPQWCRCFSSA